ncbi:MAG: hypothetical protein V1663_00275 [archaeon]
MISNGLIVILSILSLFVVAYLVMGFTKIIKREKDQEIKNQEIKNEEIKNQETKSEKK